jgi:hypothetical protein
MSAKTPGLAPRGADEAQQADRTSRGKRTAPSSRAAFFFMGAMLYAPYQCGKAPERSVREETPGEALYGLAQKMKADGDEQGYRTTLRYIVARYPSSRYAAAARMGLSTDAADGDGP